MSLENLIKNILNEKNIELFSQIYDYIIDVPKVDVSKVRGTDSIYIDISLPVKQGKEKFVADAIDGFLNGLKGVKSPEIKNANPLDIVAKISEDEHIQGIMKYITPVFGLVFDQDFITSFQRLTQAKDFKHKVDSADKVVHVKILLSGVKYEDAKYVVDRVVDVLSNVISALPED